MLNKDDTLLNELLSDDNLKIAKQRIKKNKGASGIDGMEVKELCVAFLGFALGIVTIDGRSSSYRFCPTAGSG